MSKDMTPVVKLPQLDMSAVAEAATSELVEILTRNVEKIDLKLAPRLVSEPVDGNLLMPLDDCQFWKCSDAAIKLANVARDTHAAIGGILGSDIPEYTGYYRGTKPAAARLQNFGAAKPKDTPKGAVKVAFMLHSQWPSIQVHFQPVQSKWIGDARSADNPVCHIFFSQLAKEDGLFMQAGRAAAEEGVELLEGESLEGSIFEGRQRDSTIEVTVTFPSADDGEKSFQPVFRGIDNSTVKKMRKALINNPDDLNDSDRLLAGISRTTMAITFVLAMPTAKIDLDQLGGFLIDTEFLYEAVRTHGNCWAYKMQLPSNKSLDEHDFTQSQLYVPAWLGQKFVKQSFDGQPAEIVPGRHAHYWRPDVMPDTMTAAFAAKLTTAREMHYQKQQLDRLTQYGSRKLDCTVLKNPQVDGCYMVCITVPEEWARPSAEDVIQAAEAEEGDEGLEYTGEKQVDDEDEEVDSWDNPGKPTQQRFTTQGPSSTYLMVLPAVGTRAHVRIYVGVHEIAEILGGIVHDEKQTGANIVLAGFTKDRKNNDLLTPAPEELIQLTATIAFQSDPTTGLRELAAVDAIVEENPDRKDDFLDQEDLCFSVPTSKVYRALLPSKKRIDSFKQSIAEFRIKAPGKDYFLSENRQAAANSMLAPPEGVVVLLGPPGTGKSLVVIAGIRALVKCERETVLVSAPTNDAVAALAKRMLEFNPDIDFMIFNTVVRAEDSGKRSEAYTGTAKDFDGLTNGQKADIFAEQAEQAMWAELTLKQQSSDELRPFYYHVKLRRNMESWSSKPIDQQRPEYQSSQAWFQLTRDLNDHWAGKSKKPLTEEEVDQCRKDIRAALRVCSKALIKQVPVIFVTCNSAAHPDLVEAFFPKTAIVDEAAIATRSTIAVATAPYINSLKKICLVGDHLQMSPLITSRGHNEMEGYASKSLFETLLGNRPYNKPRYRGTTFILQDSWRSHPDCNQAAELFYGPQALTTNRPVTYNPIQRDIYAYLKPRFTGTYDGTMNIAVDVRGDSVLAEKSTSSINDEEAARVVMLCETLLRDVGNTDRNAWSTASRIRPSDILVLSPYAAQVQRIKRYMRDSELNLSGVLVVNQIPTISVAKAQGKEGNIVILSMCKSNPKRDTAIGFLYEKAQLNVMLTRAKDCMFIFGNWLGWARAWESSQWKHTKRERFDRFVSIHWGGEVARFEERKNSAWPVNPTHMIIGAGDWDRVMVEGSKVSTNKSELDTLVPKIRARDTRKRVKQDYGAPAADTRPAKVPADRFRELANKKRAMMAGQGAVAVPVPGLATVTTEPSDVTMSDATLSKSKWADVGAGSTTAVAASAATTASGSASVGLAAPAAPGAAPIAPASTQAAPPQGPVNAPQGQNAPRGGHPGQRARGDSRGGQRGRGGRGRGQEGNRGGHRVSGGRGRGGAPSNQDLSHQVCYEFRHSGHCKFGQSCLRRHESG